MKCLPTRRLRSVDSVSRSKTNSVGTGTPVIDENKMDWEGQAGSVAQGGAEPLVGLAGSNDGPYQAGSGRADRLTQASCRRGEACPRTRCHPLHR